MSVLSKRARARRRAGTVAVGLIGLTAVVWGAVRAITCGEQQPAKALGIFGGSPWSCASRTGLMSAVSDSRRSGLRGVIRRVGQLLSGDSTAGEKVQLVYVRDDLARHAFQLLLMAALVTVAVIAIFDWDASAMWLPGFIGAVIWGTCFFYSSVHMLVPSGRLLDPPEGVDVGGPRNRRGWLSRLGLVLFAMASCLGFAWLADRWDVGAAAAPGQFAGYACAAALGALLVARWERAAGRRVVFDSSSDVDEIDLYASRRVGGPDS